jgi:hypothetical protein
MVLWDMVLYSLVDIYQHFGGTFAFICWEGEGAVQEKMVGMDTCTGAHEK